MGVDWEGDLLYLKHNCQGEIFYTEWPRQNQQDYS